ncbi:MAG: carbon starvation CstA family protein, partial [Candidatus Cryptobacteroides sp.]
MFSFVISIVALVLGYILYGAFVEKVFKPDPSRIPPSVSRNDGVDYVPMPAWKVYMIQFLNIAGTGPVFGAIMGAMFGPSSYLWIVFGAIFGGAVHDYFSGMLSMRNSGAGLPDLAGRYMGKGMKTFVLVFSIIVLLLVGTVFVYSPALILGQIAGGGTGTAIMIWVVVIFIYYLIATMLP